MNTWPYVSHSISVNCFLSVTWRQRNAFLVSDDLSVSRSYIPQPQITCLHVSNLHFPLSNLRDQIKITRHVMTWQVQCATPPAPPPTLCIGLRSSTSSHIWPWQLAVSSSQSCSFRRQSLCFRLNVNSSVVGSHWCSLHTQTEKHPDVHTRIQQKENALVRTYSYTRTHIDAHSGRDKHAEILPPKHFSARAASSMRQN